MAWPTSGGRRDPRGAPLAEAPSGREHERLAGFADAVRPRLAGDLRLDRMSRSLYATGAACLEVAGLEARLDGVVAEHLAERLAD